MNGYEEHKNQIDLIHSIHNYKIRTLKDMINPSKEISEMKANDKKLKQETIKAKKDDYIDNIEELKEQINHIKTYKPQQNKPVYNIENAFTPAFIDFFCKNMVYHIMHMTLIKLVF